MLSCFLFLMNLHKGFELFVWNPRVMVLLMYSHSALRILLLHVFWMNLYFVQLFVPLAFLQSLLFRFSSRCSFPFNHGRLHCLKLSFDGICMSIYYVSVFLNVDHSDLVHAPVLYRGLILFDKVLKSSLRLSQSARANW